MRIRIGFRGQPGGGLEYAVEVERAQAGLLRQVIQRWWLFRGFDPATGLRHQGGMLV